MKRTMKGVDRTQQETLETDPLKASGPCLHLILEKQRAKDTVRQMGPSDHSSGEGIAALLANIHLLKTRWQKEGRAAGSGANPHSY